MPPRGERNGLAAFGRRESGYPGPVEPPRLRDALPSDAEAIEALLALLDHAPGPERRAQLRARLETPADGDVVLVAERDGSIAGFAAATRVHPFEYPRPQLRVSAIAVASDARRSGIGAALARALEARAEAMGCFRMELTSAHALVGAHAFWRALGYRDAGRRFVRAL